ncbi:unnamed protein product [Lactuca virosa]|uniref:Ubiquitin-like protease family profile domain-containing protein n=1 Tax=Lactuca virosa TaxID=75947 RepID=A0AAU9LU80_9ASTR|nr:unnamed protein product [Lactuca virosa]
MKLKSKRIKYGEKELVRTVQAKKRKRKEITEDDAEIDKDVKSSIAKTFKKKKKFVKKDKEPIDPEKPTSLRTIMCPKMLFDVVKSINKQQRKAVREMRLGSLLTMASNGIPGKLSRYVVNCFDPDKMKINLPVGSIDITSDLIHNLLGIPTGGRKINEFDLNEKTETGTCKNILLPHLYEALPLKDVDWCAHIIDCLKVCKLHWDEKDRTDNFCGPLLLAYLDFMKNLKKDSIKRLEHPIHYWDIDKMSKRERAEILSGSFGNVDVDENIPDFNEDSDSGDEDDMSVEGKKDDEKYNIEDDENDDEDEGNNSEEIKDDQRNFELENNKVVGRKFSKRKTKPSYLICSPYIKKFVSTDKLIEDAEIKVSNHIFVRIGSPIEKVFEVKKGIVVLRGMIETLQPKLNIHQNVIDAWIEVLNFEEKSSPKKQMQRYFFDTTIMTSSMYDRKRPLIERFEEFERKIKEAMKYQKELITFEEFDLVFFPIVCDEHYCLICVDLKEKQIDVMDNNLTTSKIQTSFGDAAGELKLLFSRYLLNVNHKSALQIQNVEAEKLRMNWRSRNNDINCGVFLMRHMEVYMGDRTGNWNCGIHKKSSKNYNNQLDDMRVKYLTKILLCEINIHRKKIIQQSEVFAKKSDEKIKSLLAKGWKKKDGRIL